MQDINELLKDSAVKLLDLMLIKAEVAVEYDEANEVYKVTISSDEETGLLIGKKGQTLFSIQYILSSIVKTQTGEWKKLVVNVGDWREKQEEYYKDLAIRAAERVKLTGEPQNLYNLNASQRRLIHMALADNSEVTTESQGEGDERYLVVRQK